MEFSDLGKHCSDCKRQDFLPFYCKKCEKYYCSDHRTHHECAIQTVQTPVKKSSKKYKKKIELKCNLCKKHLKSYLAFKCKNCKKTFCIEHRYLDIHNCKNSKNSRSKNYKNHKNLSKLCRVH